MKLYRIDRKEESIAEVQRYLRAVSYRYKEVPHVGIDGLYDEETRDAVRAFQLLFSLQETGIVDEVTFERLYREFSAFNQQNSRHP